MSDLSLIANSEAAKLVRQRRRLAKQFSRICQRIRTVDARLVHALVSCTPHAREVVRDQLTSQETRMLDAIAQEGPSPINQGGAIAR